MESSGQAQIPAYSELMWPTLVAVRELGHSARLDEIDEFVIDAEGFTEEQMAVPHKDGPRTEIEYRLAWARTYLKKMEVLDNPTRGTWVTTELGKTIGDGDIEGRWKAFRKRRAEERRKKAIPRAGADADLADVDGSEEGEGWREELLQVLLKMSPDGFEHLSKRLLRADSSTRR